MLLQCDDSLRNVPQNVINFLAGRHRTIRADACSKLDSVRGYADHMKSLVVVARRRYSNARLVSGIYGVIEYRPWIVKDGPPGRVDRAKKLQ